MATNDNALTGPNHTISVLDELVHGDMPFAVFPKLDDWILLPWYYNFSAVLDSVIQTDEVGRYQALFRSRNITLSCQQGIAFCHSRLVAHRVRLLHYFLR